MAEKKSRGGQKAADLAKRNNAMVVAHLRGKTHREVAEEFGVSVATVKEVWRAQRDADRESDEEPVDIVFEHLVGFRHLRQLAHALFDEAAGTTVNTTDGEGKVTGSVTVGGNAAARVGALRLAMELHAKEIKLRQETGLLPRNLGSLQVQLDLRRIFEDFGKVLVKHNAPQEMVADLMALVQPPAQKQLEAAKD